MEEQSQILDNYELTKLLQQFITMGSRYRTSKSFIDAMRILERIASDSKNTDSEVVERLKSIVHQSILTNNDKRYIFHKFGLGDFVRDKNVFYQRLHGAGFEISSDKLCLDPFANVLPALELFVCASVLRKIPIVFIKATRDPIDENPADLTLLEIRNICSELNAHPREPDLKIATFRKVLDIIFEELLNDSDKSRILKDLGIEMDLIRCKTFFQRLCLEGYPIGSYKINTAPFQEYPAVVKAFEIYAASSRAVLINESLESPGVTTKCGYTFDEAKTKFYEEISSRQYRKDVYQRIVMCYSPGQIDEKDFYKIFDSEEFKFSPQKINTYPFEFDENCVNYLKKLFEPLGVRFFSEAPPFHLFVNNTISQIQSSITFKEFRKSLWYLDKTSEPLSHPSLIWSIKKAGYNFDENCVDLAPFDILPTNIRDSIRVVAVVLGIDVGNSNDSDYDLLPEELKPRFEHFCQQLSVVIGIDGLIKILKTCPNKIESGWFSFKFEEIFAKINSLGYEFTQKKINITPFLGLDERIVSAIRGFCKQYKIPCISDV